MPAPARTTTRLASARTRRARSSPPSAAAVMFRFYLADGGPRRRRRYAAAVREGPEAHGTPSWGHRAARGVTAEGVSASPPAPPRPGCRPGDRVLVSLHSSLDDLRGARRPAVGVVPVLLSPDLTPTERAVLAHDAEPSLDIGDEAALGELFAGAETDIAPLPLTRPMLYTSGRPPAQGVTVGSSASSGEGVVRRRGRPVAPRRATSTSSAHRRRTPPRCAQRSRRCSPGHAGGHGALRRSARAGGAARAAAHHHLHGADPYGAPPHRAGARTDERFDSLRLLFHAGSACRRRSSGRCSPSRTGVLTEFYGSTEGQFTACSDASGWPPGHGRRARRVARCTSRPGRRPRVRRERQSG